MRLSGWTLLICTMALCLCTTGPVNAAGTLTVQPFRDVGAGRIEVPVTNTLDTGDAPSIIQFDIQYDSTQIRPVEVAAGAAAEAAGKGVSYNIVQPGVVRVITAGLNQAPITDGEIASITFEPVETATSGEVDLTIRNTVMADGDANVIVSHGVDGSITLDVGEEETSERTSTGLEPIVTPANRVGSAGTVSGSGDASVVGPPETMPARVMIPGVVDTVIPRQPAGAVSAPSQPSTEQAAPSGPAAPELRTTVVGVPDAVPGQPTVSPTAGRDVPAPSRSVPSLERDISSGPERPPTDEISEFELQQETESAGVESDTDPSEGSSRRMGIVAIEICAVIVALVLFLGARKLFKV